MEPDNTKPDNFDLRLMHEGLHYFHEELPRLIDAVTEEEKARIESFSREISRRFRHKVELTWGYDLVDGKIEKVLAHICSLPRHCLHLTDPGDIKRGHLKYQGHNLDSNLLQAPAYAVAVMYIAILNGHGVRNPYTR